MSETMVPVAVNTVTPAPYDPNLFHSIAQQVRAKYDAVVKEGTVLFRVGLKRGKLFETYLNNLPDNIRQHMNCDCCRSFLSRFGGLVTISTEAGSIGEITSVLWSDVNSIADPVFEKSIHAMRELVESTPVEFTFLSKHKVLGDPEKGGFNHFSLVNKIIFEDKLREPHEIVAEQVQSYSNLSKFLGTTEQNLIDQVATFFKNDARLKDQTKWVGHIEWLANFKRERELLKRNEKTAFTWLQIATQSPGRVDIKNSPIGKFIKNILGGDNYDVATKKFLEMTRGDNYMRATEAPKAGNVKRAEVIFEKLELRTATERRFLTHPELRGKIWEQPVVEQKAEDKPLFGHLATRDDKPAAPKLPEINFGPITLERFMKEVLPEVVEMRLDGNYHTRYNIAGYTTAVHADAQPILMWDKEDNRNPVSSYVYQGFSPLKHWGLDADGYKPKIVAIVNSEETWGQEGDAVFGKHSVSFVFEKGHDAHLRGVPMFAETFRPELHEVRSTLEAFFRNGSLTPLEPGQQAVVGIPLPIQGQCFLPLIVTKKDAIVRYQIDRAK